MIRIRKNTSREDIDKHWIFSKEYPTEIHFSNNSSFQELTESYASSYLSKFGRGEYKIDIIVSRSSTITNYLSGVEDDLDHPLMSIFGLQLLHISTTVSFEGDKTTNIRQELTAKIWQSLIDSGGLIGKPRKTYYISNHVKPVPDIFGGEKSPRKYAKYQLFYSNFSSVLDELTAGTSGIEQTNKQKLIGAAFHAAENSSDHARFKEEEKIKGFWGIALSRLHFENKQAISDRGNLPRVMCNYLKSNFALLNKGNNSGISCFLITVSDNGLGIQKSLERKYKLEPIELIHKAFEDLVTSKTEEDFDPSERTGFGLGDLVLFLRELGALLHIYTGGQELYSDFSDKQEKSTEEQKRQIKLAHLDETKSERGTSISIVWINQADKLQDSLFN